MQDLRRRIAPAATADIKAEVVDMQRQAVIVTCVAFFFAAVPLAVAAQGTLVATEVFFICDFLCVLAIGSAALSTRNYTAAAWTLVAGWLLTVLLIVVYAGLTSALPLLSLSVALAAILIRASAGAAVAVSVSLLLLVAPTDVVAADTATRAFTLIQVWAALGLTALMQGPLLAAAGWAWYSYERSRELLDEARDYQVRLKEALEDLAKANQQLAYLNESARRMQLLAEEARAAKERFASNVSHELRTPLNMIVGFAELMLSSPRSYGRRIPPQMAADLEIILRNARHLSDLINDILDLSQVEASRMGLTKEWVHMSDIVETAVATVGGLFATKGLYLTTDVPGDLPPLLCDPTRIRQVLLNLLSNAARFTEKGGVRVAVSLDRDCLLISVADTGPGVDPKHVDRLFQPFEQLDASIRRRSGGTGLGLSISKHFVELHRGTMWLESELGHGCTVFTRLPVDPDVPQPSTTARWLDSAWEYHERTRPSRITPQVVRPRVVVVESGVTLRHLLRRYLDDVELAPFGTLAEAVADISRLPAQAIVINDTSVPDALQRISGEYALPDDLPTIICSVPETASAAESLGASDYLVKPISQDRLLAMLDKLCLPKGIVLVVDDDQEALVLFMRMLEASDRGYRVMAANNGLQALRIMRERKPDVVLLDLVMPEMDGFQVLHICREDPALTHIPIIVISARDPLGRPVVSSAIALTQAGGLAADHIVAVIQSMQAMFSPRLRPDQEQPAVRIG